MDVLWIKLHCEACHLTRMGSAISCRCIGHKFCGRSCQTQILLNCVIPWWLDKVCNRQVMWFFVSFWRSAPSCRSRWRASCCRRMDRATARQPGSTWWRRWGKHVPGEWSWSTSLNVHAALLCPSTLSAKYDSFFTCFTGFQDFG